MPKTKNVSAPAVGVCAALSALALPIYALMLATFSDLAGSDAAGNAYAQAYGAIELIFVWLLIAVITLIAFFKGVIPRPAAIAAVILIPASGIVSMSVLGLLSGPHQPPYLWPIVIPATIPPLVVAFSFWALLPRLRAAIPARTAASTVWGAVLLLCLAIVPFDQVRNRADDEMVAAREKIAADYAKLPADAALWDLLPFMASLYDDKEAELRERVRARAKRQVEAELMLERGDFLPRYLGAIDLDPTPSLCTAALTLLHTGLEQTARPRADDPRPYRELLARLGLHDPLSALIWLAEHNCDAGPELSLAEDLIRSYQESPERQTMLASLARLHRKR